MFYRVSEHVRGHLDLRSLEVASQVSILIEIYLLVLKSRMIKLQKRPTHASVGA
jgi:hypothetical protein